MSQDTLLKSARERMDKAIDHTKEMLRGIRTSRASSALVDNVRVDYYGTMTPLSQMAQVSVPEARVLVIKPFDMTALKEIEKITKMIAEMEEYEREVLYPLATEQVEIDLDDGVKVNYPKFGAALKKIDGLEAKEG